MGFAAVTTLGLLGIYRLAQRILSPARAFTAVFSDAVSTPNVKAARAPREGEGDAAVEQAPPSLGAPAPQRARRLLRVGEVLAVFAIAASVVKNCLGGDLARDAMLVAAYGLAGLLLLSIFGRLGVRLLFGSSLTDEIERGNVAAGVAAGGHYVAVGLLVSRAAAGDDLKSLGLVLVFFTLSQLSHQLLVALFRALTTYDDAEQITGENVAAALSYAGISVAVALIIARALEGDFNGWSASLRGFGLMVAYALVLYPVRQIVVQSLLLGGRLSLRGGTIDRAIAVHRSEGTAAMEAVTCLATALTITTLA